MEAAEQDNVAMHHTPSSGREPERASMWMGELNFGPRPECIDKFRGAPYPVKVLEKVVPFSALPATCSEVNNDAATSGVSGTLPRSCAGF
jgi:hypothetical protein